MKYFDALSMWYGCDTRYVGEYFVTFNVIYATSYKCDLRDVDLT